MKMKNKNSLSNLEDVDKQIVRLERTVSDVTAYLDIMADSLKSTMGDNFVYESWQTVKLGGANVVLSPNAARISNSCSRLEEMGVLLLELETLIKNNSSLIVA